MSIKSYFLSKISKDSSEEITGASDSKKQPEAKGAGTSGKRKAADADTETKTANVAGKIQHPLPSVVYHIRPGIIGRSVDAGFRSSRTLLSLQVLPRDALGRLH